jgi:uncharacterized damage-inducible protein DinB
MLEGLKQQYDWIRSVREVLFTFLEEIPLHKLHETVPGFGISTIIGAHIHAADSYRYWLGSFAFKQNPADFRDTTEYEVEHSNVKNVRDRFDVVDEIVQKFLDEFNDRWFENIENEVDWRDKPLSLPPLFLLTHAETHEFHHKGQIVSMARHLGFNPPADDRLGALFS